jgi:hypothetical protein
MVKNGVSFFGEFLNAFIFISYLSFWRFDGVDSTRQNDIVVII